MEIPKSTIRLAQVVKECGQPEPVTLWVRPRKEPGFQAAVQENRVMTVIQETKANRKDFGVVGFHRTDHAAYWVFPKPLNAFKGKRVIGINYDLLKMPNPKDAVKLTTEPEKKAPPMQEGHLAREPAKTSVPEPQLEKAKPQLHCYRVVIRSIATAENAREVHATSAKEAEKLALKMATGETVEFSAEAIVRRVTGVRRV
jgi:hypothetical protein